MAATYGIVNFIASFGFAARWRHQLVEGLPLANASHVVDLMSGMNELCRSVAPHAAPTMRLTAIDISPEMIHRARKNWPFRVDIHLQDVLTAATLAARCQPASPRRRVFFCRDFSPAGTASANPLPLLLEPRDPLDRPPVSRQSRQLPPARRLHASLRQVSPFRRMSPPARIGSV
jgi:hypothetical protein